SPAPVATRRGRGGAQNAAEKKTRSSISPERVNASAKNDAASTAVAAITWKIGGVGGDCNFRIAFPGDSATTIRQSNDPISPARIGFRDRKSTRLNSSHLVISY